MDKIKTPAGIRKAFWAAHPQFASEYRKTQPMREYRASITVSFKDFVTALQNSDQISQALAKRVR